MEANAKKPLAITTSRQSFFAFRDYSSEHVDRLASEFKRAAPFPHLVLERFLHLTPDAVEESYPAPDSHCWSKRGDFYQSGKMYCRDTDLIEPLLVSMFYELSSPPFLSFLERVTGISGLIPDPYYEGGGLHCSGPGGVLVPHTDFHYYERLRLYRRVNLLLYLNPEWEESWGGCLELSRKGEARPTTVVVPRWGTCVIFRTDDESVHGFSTPIEAGHWRRSIALYYYSSLEAERFSGGTYTNWRQHGTQRGLNRLRMLCYQLLIRSAQKLSSLAHQANPNKERL
ncbi:MAG TPA: 2OG-Fe(II) oxygenase [Thermoanaerobaculia bacterium]|nr:2OG-Fe(II) oxygenase [Thermoanaerobaculia bacterium]